MSGSPPEAPAPTPAELTPAEPSPRADATAGAEDASAPSTTFAWAADVGVEPSVAARIISVLEEGLTPPVIARYRRDEVGGVAEDRIAAVRARLAKQRTLQSRKEAVTRSLQGQRKLSDELKGDIEAADSLHRLDDLYAAHKPGQSTPAGEARNQGLEPLADEVVRKLPSAANLDSRAAEFVDAEKGVANAAAAVAGAGHILAERFANHAEARRRVRRIVKKTAKVVCRRAEKVKDKKAEPYKPYFDYAEPLAKTPPHRTLAINRGEKSGVLEVSVECDADACVAAAKELLAPPEHAHAELLAGCVDEAVRGQLLPALTSEARVGLTDRADTHSLEVFAKNLRNLLLGPRLPGKRVLAIDPGYQNGCHVAAIDEAGAVLATEKVMIVDDAAATEARAKLAELVTTHTLGLIAIGNGKACRPTEELVSKLLAEELKDQPVEYLVVSEAGANVYAGSPIGREELPDLEQPLRGAVSIGRRVQDPLAELVKVDPSSVGVGLYQHDARGKPIQDTLEDVVRSCVAAVGVDLNTASAALLRYVPGLNALSARRLVEHRAANGPYVSRAAAKESPGLNETAWVQSAGFLRVTGGDEPLDATWVHPEHYDAARKVLEAAGMDAGQLIAEGGPERFSAAEPITAARNDAAPLAEAAGIGPLQLKQLLDALAKPGHDPRDDLPPTASRRGVVRLEELQPGAQLQGVVQNVVDFGAFVDVGLSDSGLLHVSRMSSGYVNDPHAVVAVGQSVTVWVDSVDAQRRRVSLSLIDPSAPKPPRPNKPGGRRGRGRSAKPTEASTSQASNAAANSGGQPAAPSTGAKSGEARRGGQRSGRQRSGGGQHSGGQQRDRRGGKRGAQRQQPSAPRTYEARAKGPPKPITQEMEEGKEAMRSFGDLMQLFEKKKGEDDAEANESSDS